MSGENTSENLDGRKIFFLYPTASIQNQIISELAQQEYEVYAAKDHARLARTLKKFPDSIVFVNIDEQISESESKSKSEWEKWIANLLTALPDVKIGCFSSSSDEELKNKYINKLHVSCVFMGLKVDMTKVVDQVLEALRVIDAKGRRKYLRASVEREANATMNIPLDGEFLNGTVKDISIVGISCVFEHDPNFKKNSLYKNIQIKLQSVLLKVEAVVFGSRESEGQKVYVLLFTQRVDPETRAKIRRYVQQSLQAKMDHIIN